MRADALLPEERIWRVHLRNKFLTFDAAGNRKALALLKGSKKGDDLRVEVTGEIQADTINVTSLKLL
jgi:hypothetical protein